MSTVLLSILVTCVFYLFLPFTGAVMARSKWRNFRYSILDSSNYPVYGSVDHASRFRFFGELEAFEGEDVVWLTDGRHRVRVELGNEPVFVLPGRHGVEESTEDPDFYDIGSPEVTRWKDLGSLPEGTGFFIAGFVDTSGTVPSFRSTDTMRLLPVIHNTEPDRVLARAIATGRQRNEFWNSITPFAMLAGVMLQLFLLIQQLQTASLRLETFFLISQALLPGIILAPPGIFLYFLYRNLWREGRVYRAERDMLMLPLRYRARRLPDGGTYLAQEIIGLEESMIHDENIRFRRPRVREPGDVVWYFGPVGSSDPFAESLYIVGNPQELAIRSQGRAQRREFFAIGAFIAGVLVNSLLFQVVLILFLI